METIGETIIEVHLRFAREWPDLYGLCFFPALVVLYCRKGWIGPSSSLPSTSLQTSYCVVLFNDEKCAKTSMLAENVYSRQLEGSCGESSITMQYYGGLAFESVARPERGGYRIAWINGFDLERCKMVREVLRDYL